jgi:hypothetical protein
MIEFIRSYRVLEKSNRELEERDSDMDQRSFRRD